MAAEDQVLTNIDNAWSLANSSIDQATGFASNAVQVAQTLVTADPQQYDLSLPSNAEVQNNVASKLTEIGASVDDTLTSTIPDAYQKLFKDLINQGGNVVSAFGSGTADASDTMSLVDGMSQAFSTLNFNNNSATLESFLSTGMLTGNGGTTPYGVPINVENAITDRAIGKIDLEAVQAEEDAAASYAARGFPLPSGMMVSRINEVQDKAQAQKSSAIKDVAIEQGKRGFEATQNYVKQFQDLQGQNADAFNTYLRSVIAARSGASDDVKALIGSVSELQKSIVSLYSYTMDEREVLVRQAIAEGQLGMTAAQINVDAYSKRAQTMAGTSIAAAQAMGNMAAAAVSSQNSMSRISADTITNS